MKKKYLALLLSLAVVCSGTPVITTNAAPADVIQNSIILETNTEKASTVSECTLPTEETTEEAFQTTEVYTEPETLSDYSESSEWISPSETEESFLLEDNSNTESAPTLTKAVGQNGILYDDVAYLSVSAVNQLPSHTQRVYQTMCDDISTWKESGLNVSGIAISVNKDGDITMTASIPAQTAYSDIVSSIPFEPENETLVQAFLGTEEYVSGIPYVELETLLKNENLFRNVLSEGFERTLYDNGKTSIVVNGNNYISVNKL